MQGIDVEELHLLMKIPKIEHILKGQILLIKATHREEINQLKKAMTKKLMLMPNEKASEYEFTLKKELEGWEATIDNDDYDLPINYIMPEELKEKITENICQLGEPRRIDHIQGRHGYSVIYTKFSTAEIKGTIYRTKTGKDKDQIPIVKIKLAQYLSKEIDEQWRIVNKHIEGDLELKKELCKLFFINLLPMAEKVQELIS